MKNQFILSAAMTFSMAAFSLSAHANNVEEQITLLNEIKVIGGQEELANPLAPNRITKEKFEKQQFTDVTRALKQTSGVYVREEEGQGLRPNIGLRGTNPDRSKKIVIMEDGILIGPAPYSAPAAYYTPSMNHTEGMEVYKGFQSVPYGPNSIGGAVNYLSRKLPSRRADITLNIGSFETANLKTQFGNEQTLLNMSHWRSAGFKKIDQGGDAGFVKNDLHFVHSFNLSDSDKVNALVVRAGYGDEDSHETYLGLTEEDFSANPFRRYLSSALDEMKWRHYKLQLEHQFQLAAGVLLKTQVYRHNFTRAWYRLDRFGDNKKIGEILKDPTANSMYYEVLTGQRDSSTLGGGGQGNLVLANNDRSYFSQGIQSTYSQFIDQGQVTQELEMSLRIHQDQIDRNHTYDTWSVTDKKLELVTAGNADLKNRDSALAQTLSLLDTIRWNQWSFIVAARAENVQFKNKNKTTGVSKDREDSILVPGLGLQYQWSDSLTTRGSVNKAVTVAGLDSTGKEKSEEATNYELGARFYSADLQLNGDLTFFVNDYQNLTGTCTASNGCASGNLDQQLNGGKALIQGFEVSVAKGFEVAKYWVPVFLNATFIEAEFKNDFNSSSGEWGTGDVVSGDPLPYVPEVQYTFGVGLQRGPWEQELTVIYQGAMYDQSVADGRLKTEAYGLVDWAGKWKHSDQISFFAKAENIFDRKYVTSIKPFGYRPGKPQSFTLGANWVF